MKPESARFVDQADIMLVRADIMLSVSLNEEAARVAYMACFHIAQAYNYERTSKTAKSHKGVQVEFFYLSKGDTRADPELRRFLSKAYDFKSVADYFTGDAATTSAQEATDAVATAKCFVQHFRMLIWPTTTAPMGKRG